MSAARHDFCTALTGLREALQLDPIANAASGHGNASGATILRRGLLIAGLVTLESFVRRRTEELLIELAAWPGSFNSLPEKLKYQALIEAPNRLHRYAKVLRRQGGDFESEVTTELTKMSRTTGPSYGFSKYIAGDFTGNLSEEGLRDLLACFLIKDVWPNFHTLSSSIGFGAPSIRVLLNNVIQRRHKSAHDPAYVPATSDVQSLDEDVLILAICFDTAISASVKLALQGSWSVDQVEWLNAIEIFSLEKAGAKIRICKPTGQRALKIADNDGAARTFIASKVSKKTKLVVMKSPAGLPSSWYIA